MLKKIILILFLFSCEYCFPQYSDFIFKGTAFLGDFMGETVNFDSIISKDEALLKEFKVKSLYYKDKKGRLDEVIKYENGKIVELSIFSSDDLVPLWNYTYSYYPNGLLKEVEEIMFGKYHELYKFSINDEKYKSIVSFSTKSKYEYEFVFEYNNSSNHQLFTKLKKDFNFQKIYNREYNIVYNTDNKITEINYKDLSDSNENEVISNYRFSSDSIFVYEKNYSKVYIIRDNRIYASLIFDEGKFSSKSTYFYKENNLVDYILYEEKGKKPFIKEYKYVFE